jgi:hypothetical protein
VAFGALLVRRNAPGSNVAVNDGLEGSKLGGELEKTGACRASVDTEPPNGVRDEGLEDCLWVHPSLKLLEGPFHSGLRCCCVDRGVERSVWIQCLSLKTTCHRPSNNPMVRAGCNRSARRIFALSVLPSSMIRPKIVTVIVGEFSGREVAPL